MPEDGRIYSEQLHEQIGAELFIKQVEIAQETVAFVKKYSYLLLHSYRLIGGGAGRWNVHLPSNLCNNPRN